MNSSEQPTDAHRIREILRLAEGLTDLNDRELAPCLYEIKRLVDSVTQPYELDEDRTGGEICFKPKPYTDDRGGKKPIF